jgi:UDP-N-acetylglucosamine 4,6-dehydratase
LEDLTHEVFVINSSFFSKSLLITRGTGSFGNVVIRKFSNTDIKEIRIFSRDKKKQDDIRSAYRNDKLKFYIGNVRDYDSVHFSMHVVDYVFHAAALKQVPSCEFFPLEAVRIDILGTKNVLNAAIYYPPKDEKALAVLAKPAEGRQSGKL